MYSVIEQIVCENYNVEEVEFEQEKDKKYIKDVMLALKEIGVLVEEEDRKKRIYDNKQVSIELTNNCNLKCVHCCVGAGEREKKDLDTDCIIEILEKCIKWNPEEINLSGGEPLLRKDFFEILQYLRKRYKGHITLSTNGTLINCDNVLKLCDNLDQIDISLDGVDEKTCSAIRGRGVFNKVIKTIELLHINGFQNISLSMVVANKNERLEQEFRKLNERIGTRPVIRMFAEIGRGAENTSFFLDKSSSSIYIPEQFLKGNFVRDSLGARCCGAGRNELFIRYNGEVFPCPSYMNEKYLLGNVLNVKNLNELTIKSKKNIEEVMRNMDLINSEKCRECNVSLFCWTCPGEAYRLKKQFELSEYCNKCKEILYRKVWEE